MAVSSELEKCTELAVLDANMLLSSTIPDCKRVLLVGYESSSSTKMRLYSLYQFYDFCFFTPERILRIAKFKLREQCEKLGKKRKKKKEKAEETYEKVENELQMMLDELNVLIISEKEYESYLDHPLVREVGDENDDNHLIAAALYLKERYGLEKVFVLSYDLSIPNAQDLENAGIILVSNLGGLMRFN